MSAPDSFTSDPKRLRIESERWLDAEFEIDPDGDLRIVLGSDSDMDRSTYLLKSEAMQLRDWLNEVLPAQQAGAGT